MLAFPFKKTDEVDLAGPFKRFLQKELPEEAGKYESDIDSLRVLRREMAGAVTPSDSNREVITRYYVELNNTITKFPIMELKNEPGRPAVLSIKVLFTWTDAFKFTRKSAHGSYAFEEAGVLYNLAALESHAGSLLDRSTAEGLKGATRQFHLAAGLFLHIRFLLCLGDNVMLKLLSEWDETLYALLLESFMVGLRQPSGDEGAGPTNACSLVTYRRDQLLPGLPGGRRAAVTSDLTAPGLGMAANVMLAQAQACILELCVLRTKEGTAPPPPPPQALAKIAHQAAEFFHRASQQAQAADLAGTLDQSWRHHLAWQVRAFGAQAEYWQARHLQNAAQRTATGYGEVVRRLTIAAETARSLVNQDASKVSHKLVEQMQDLGARAGRLLETAANDNNAIYHEVVPAASALVPIGKVSMVKEEAVLPESLTQPGGGAALFAGLLPAWAVRAAAAHVRGAKDTLAGLEAAVREADRAGRDALAEVGLPGSLEAYQTAAGVPDALWARLERARAGLAELRRAAAENGRGAQRAGQLLAQIGEAVAEEEAADAGFRAQWPTYEGAAPSRDLAADLRTDAAEYRALAATAQEADGALASRLAHPDFEAFAQLLPLDRNALSALVPSRGTAAAGSGVDLSELSGLLAQLAQALARRGALLQNARVTAEVESDLVVDRLGGAHTEERCRQVLEEEHRKYAELEAEVRATVDAQPALLRAILQADAEFRRARETDEVTLAREEFLQRLNAGLGTFAECSGQAREGGMFYADLLRRLAQLLQAAQDLAYTQRLQREEWARNLEQMRQDEELAHKLDAEARVAAQPVPAPAPAASAPTYPSMPGGGGGGVAAPPLPSAPPSYAAVFQRQTSRDGGVQAFSASNPFATSGGGGSGGGGGDPKVGRLVELGFAEASARAALARHDGDLDAAANDLFNA